MSLAPGVRLGPYEVVAPLGAGGMGEVYRARDTKLKRDIALKLLPDSFANDPDRLARFEREAQVLAALNHPHIAAIHGFEQSGSVRALVMELIEGEDLAQRIARGPVTIDEALPIARQIAEALEAAHEQGIVHRDLKPANIKIRDDGTVKVLDFGLAKALEATGRADSAAAADGALNSPTITSPAHTQQGVILGTAAYMSPEQARGRAVDKRADIWAFGAILHEMLTAKRLFDGETISDTIAAVLTRPVDLKALPASTPLRLRELIARCLERDPKRRLRDIGEARVSLETPAAGEPIVEPAMVMTPRAAPAWRAAAPWIVAVAAMAIAGWSLWSQPAPSPSASVELELAPPPDSEFIIGSNAGGPVISPDGSTVVFLARTAKGVSLWIRSLERNDARALPGTDGASYPFWSPDSGRLAFFAGSKLRVIDVASGLPTVIADATGGRGGTFTDNGTILFSPRGGSTVFQVPAGGGTAAPVTTLDDSRGENAHYFPVALPGGQTFLFFIRSAQSENNGIYLGRIDGSQPPQRVVTSLSSALYVPAHDEEPHRLLWVRDTDLLAQAFEPSSGRLEGPVSIVATDVRVEEAQRAVLASVSQTGMLVWASAQASALNLVWYDRTGRRGETVAVPAGRVTQPTISPDGTKLVFTRVEAGSADVWLHEFTSGTTRPLSTSPYYDERPSWSHDGRFVAYAAYENAVRVIRIVAIDGSTPPRTLAVGVTAESPIFSHDGRYIFFDTPHATRDYDIMSVRLDDPASAGTAAVLVGTPDAEWVLGASPDGRWLGLATYRAGKQEVLVGRLRLADGAVSVDPNWQSSGIGDGARWRNDGRELVFSTLDGMLMAVAISVSSSGAVQFGKPTPLFRIHTNAGGWQTSFAPAPDHAKFVVTEAPYTQRQTARVLTNWEARLTAR